MSAQSTLYSSLPLTSFSSRISRTSKTSSSGVGSRLAADLRGFCLAAVDRLVIDASGSAAVARVATVHPPGCGRGQVQVWFSAWKNAPAAQTASFLDESWKRGGTQPTLTRSYPGRGMARDARLIDGFPFVGGNTTDTVSHSSLASQHPHASLTADWLALWSPSSLGLAPCNRGLNLCRTSRCAAIESGADRVSSRCWLRTGG